MYTCTVAYTGRDTFSKVPKKHAYLYLVGLYAITYLESLKSLNNSFDRCPEQLTDEKQDIGQLLRLEIRQQQAAGRVQQAQLMEHVNKQSDPYGSPPPQP